MQTNDPALIKTPIVNDNIKSDSTKNDDIKNDDIEEHTTVNKGTDTFDEDVIESEHVNDDDNPARQPDRRDQKGNPFDGGINEHNKPDDEQKSEEITDKNRYASVDNAQTRVLNPDEKDAE